MKTTEDRMRAGLSELVLFLSVLLAIGVVVSVAVGVALLSVKFPGFGVVVGIAGLFGIPFSIGYNR